MLPRRYMARAARRCGCGGAGPRTATALLALAVVGALRVPLARRCRHAAALPRAPPHALAVHLADFNNLRKLHPHIESWRIDDQWSNYTSWRYSLQFSCGARCAGRGAVRAHDEYAGPTPAHGHATAAHRVRLDLATCRTLPLLPWPAFCEELEVEWAVVGDGAGGARLQEAAAARAALAPAALRWLHGAGAGAPGAAHALLLATLREAFP